MARGINKVILIGNLGAQPEVRVSANGATVANLSIATNETWKDQKGDQRTKTEWHKVVLFNRLAEIARDYLNQGSTVYIEGKIQSRKYTDKQGNDRYLTEVIASQMNMLSSVNSKGGIQDSRTQDSSRITSTEEGDIPWDVPGEEVPDWLDPDQFPF